MGALRENDARLLCVCMLERRHHNDFTWLVGGFKSRSGDEAEDTEGKAHRLELVELSLVNALGRWVEVVEANYKANCYSCRAGGYLGSIGVFAVLFLLLADAHVRESCCDAAAWQVRSVEIHRAKCRLELLVVGGFSVRQQGLPNCG